MNSIDESTKLFQKYLRDKAPEREKMNKKNSYPRVQGGLPPHLLNVRQDTDEHVPPVTQRAPVSAFALTLLTFHKLT